MSCACTTVQTYQFGESGSGSGGCVNDNNKQQTKNENERTKKKLSKKKKKQPSPLKQQQQQQQTQNTVTATIRTTTGGLFYFYFIIFYFLSLQPIFFNHLSLLSYIYIYTYINRFYCFDNMSASPPEETPLDTTSSIPEETEQQQQPESSIEHQNDEEGDVNEAEDNEDEDEQKEEKEDEDGDTEAKQSPDNNDAANDNEEGGNLSEASTEESTEESAEETQTNPTEDKNNEQQQQDDDDAESENKVESNEHQDNVNSNDNSKQDSNSDNDMQFDIPDAPDVIDSASESGKQEPTNVDADDNQDKMDVDIPQETSIAFTTNTQNTNTEEYEKEESKQELGEDEELKHIQEDDPSFDENYNSNNDPDKSNDDFDTSALINGDDFNMEIDDLDYSKDVESESNQQEGKPEEEEEEQKKNSELSEVKSNVESTSDQKESEIKEESTGENPNESQPTTTSVVGASATEPLSSNQNTSIASSEVKTNTTDKDVDMNQQQKEVEPESKEKEEDEEDEEDDQEEEDEDEPEEPPKEKPQYKQTHLIVIPSYASWFNMKKIHKIEKESLPEFFDSIHPSKSPKLYVNYRNFMINSYRLNPNEFLTLTSCRRNLVGDVGTLMRVHRFLNKWGLINYQVRPQFKPGYALEKMPNGQSMDLPYTGDYHVKFDTPRGLFPFDTSRIPVERVDVKKLQQLMDESSNSNSGEVKQEKQPPPPQQPPQQQQKQNGNKGKKHGLEEEEKVEIEGSQPPLKKKHQEDGWTKTEKDALISAVKTFKNDWYKIAHQVGGKKTPEQCILEFLKLPLEDKFNPINDEDETNIKLLKYASNYPISSIDNPVLANLTFMTKLVDSNVAKAASEAAKKAMDESIENKVQEVYNGNNNTNGGSVERQSSGKDAIATTFGIIGGRSHLFSNYEEREMHKIGSSIVNHEISKIETKLDKVEELEKIYERERQNMLNQQEELFIDRISLTKSTIGVIKKLEEAIKLIESNNNNNNNNTATGSGGGVRDSTNINGLLNEAKSLLYKPTRRALEQIKNGDNTNNTASNNSTTGDDVNDGGSKINSTTTGGSTTIDVELQDDSFKPLSLKTPQTFKIWAP